MVGNVGMVLDVRFERAGGGTVCAYIRAGRAYGRRVFRGVPDRKFWGDFPMPGDGDDWTVEIVATDEFSKFFLRAVKLNSTAASRAAASAAWDAEMAAERAAAQKSAREKNAVILVPCDDSCDKSFHHDICALFGLKSDEPSLNEEIQFAHIYYLLKQINFCGVNVVDSYYGEKISAVDFIKAHPCAADALRDFVFERVAQINARASADRELDARKERGGAFPLPRKLAFPSFHFAGKTVTAKVVRTEVSFQCVETGESTKCFGFDRGDNIGRSGSYMATDPGGHSSDERLWWGPSSSTVHYDDTYAIFLNNRTEIEIVDDELHLALKMLFV